MPIRPKGIPFRYTYTEDLDEHVALIKEQLDKSMRDPDTRQLAVAVVSDRVQWRTLGGIEGPHIRAFDRWFYDPAYFQPDAPCPPRNDECEITKIWNFLCAPTVRPGGKQGAPNFRYVYDPPATDLFATTRVSMQAGGGDCDDAVITFGSLLKPLGFPVAARVVTTRDNPGEWVHIYPMVGVPKDNTSHYIPLDCTVEGATPGWEYPEIHSYRDYMM